MGFCQVATMDYLRGAADEAPPCFRDGAVEVEGYWLCGFCAEAHVYVHDGRRAVDDRELGEAGA